MKRGRPDGSPVRAEHAVEPPDWQDARVGVTDVSPEAGASHRGPRTGPSRAAVVGLVAFALGLAFTISRSVTSGRAGAEITYDDVSYALGGNRYASVLLDSGAIALAGELVRNPPHGPLTEATAALAILIFGPSTFGIYLLNGMVIAGLTLLAARATMPTAWPGALIASGIFLASPLGYFFVDQFRPDLAYLVILALLTGLCSQIRRPAPWPSRHLPWWCGAAAAALLYAKPSFIVFTFVALVTLAIWSALVMQVRPSERRPRLRFLLHTVGAFLIATIPFWILLFPGALQYVLANTVGPLAPLWKTATAFEAVRESTLQAANAAGWSVRVCAVAAAVALVIALVARRPSALVRSTAFFAVGVVSLGPLALSQGIGPFFGMVPVFMLMVGCVVAVADVVTTVVRPAVATRQARSRWGSHEPEPRASLGRLAAGSVAAVAAAAYLGGQPYPAIAGARPPLSLNERVLTAVLEQCQKNAACDGEFTSIGALPPLMVSFASEITKDSVQWEAIEDQWNGEVAGMPFLVETTQAVEATQDLQFVVTLGPRAEYVNTNLPFNQIQPELNAHLESSAAWQEVAVPGSGLRFRLFQRIVDVPLG